jgi:iron complex transport system substrate-binding protein
MSYLRRSILPVALLATILGLCSFVGGCTEHRAPIREEGGGPRIVSLSPALSRILIDLGLQDSIVGCTPWAPDELVDVPVVGDLLRPDLERISMVDPDLIIVQPTQRGIDPALRAFAEQRDWQLIGWELNRLADVDRVLDELPVALDALGVDDRDTFRRVEAWRQRRVELLVPDPVCAELGRCLLLFGVDPPMAFGRETYIDDLWSSLGGVNAIEGTGYLECSLEDLVVLEPSSVLVIASSPDQARSQVARLRSDLGPRVGDIDFRPLGSPGLLVPGTGILDGVMTLRDALTEGDR